MADELTVASARLARMRGMNAAYHRQFFSDIRFTFLVALGVFIAAFGMTFSWPTDWRTAPSSNSTETKLVTLSVAPGVPRPGSAS